MERLRKVKRERHLYERTRRTADGEVRYYYYAIFTCKLKRKRRVIALGSDLDAAKVELAEILADNMRGDGKDFDAVKKPVAEGGMTFAKWTQDYFDKKVDPEKRASGVEREKRSFKALEPYFGHMPLGDIKRSVITDYRNKRLQDPVMRCCNAKKEKKLKPVMVDGKPKTVSFSTVNRELALLRFLLNLAEEDGKIDAAPRFTGKDKSKRLIKSEKDRRRERVAEPDEIAALLENMPRRAQRVVVALLETAMRAGEVINLRWDMGKVKVNGKTVKAGVDDKAGFIRLPASYVKEKKDRSVPITPALQAVFDELKAEQRQIPNVLGRVFTRAGKPIKSIRKAFELACSRAGIEDLRLHDFRHTAITNWAAEGKPQAVIMAAAGHHSVQQNDSYTNIKEGHLKAAFGGEIVQRPLYGNNAVENQNAASY